MFDIDPDAQRDWDRALLRYPVFEKGDLMMPEAPAFGDELANVFHGSLDSLPVRQIIYSVYHLDYQEKGDFVQALIKMLDHWKRASDGHKNIVAFKGLVNIPSNRYRPSILTPLFDMTIDRYLCLNPEINRLLLLAKVAGAVAYMHGLDPPVVHGGICGENIAIDQAGEPLLCDSCLACLPRSYPFTRDPQTETTVRWMAPEVTEELPGEFGELTPETDVFAFGMTILQILTGAPPYAGQRWNEVHQKIARHGRPDRPNGIANELWDLVTKCSERKPVERLTMRSVRDELLRLARVASGHA